MKANTSSPDVVSMSVLQTRRAKECGDCFRFHDVDDLLVFSAWMHFAIVVFISFLEKECFTPGAHPDLSAFLARTTVVLSVSHVLNAELLVQPFASRQKVSLAVTAARAGGTCRNAMEQENRQSRRHLFWANRQYLRLRARHLEVGFGCNWKLLHLCPETMVSGTTLARRADLLRWVDAQDVSQKVGKADGASSGFLRSRYLDPALCITQNADLFWAALSMLCD